MINIDYVWEIINEIETNEYNNSVNYDPILHNARCGDRMRAWEKLIYWDLDGIDVC